MHFRAAAYSGRMTHRRSDFKPSQLYDWEIEPHDERPSEFAQSTGYRVHSGFYVAPVVSARRRSNGVMVWLMASAVAGLAVAGLLVLVKVLRG
jgi:hypothetical protein